VEILDYVVFKFLNRQNAFLQLAQEGMILYILPDILGVIPELRGETFQIMVPFEPIANILARRRLFSVGGVQSARIRAGVSQAN
jgi:hypothetical protein